MRRLVVRIVAALLALTLGGLALGQTLNLSQAEATRDPVRPDDPASLARAHWQPVTLPHNWRGDFPGYSGVVWYRIRLEGHGGAAPSSLMALYMERACANMALWLNGQAMGGVGSMGEPDQLSRRCYQPNFYTVVPSQWRAQGNELLIQLAGQADDTVAAPDRAAGLSAVQFGPQADLQAVFERDLYISETLQEELAAFFVVIGFSLLGVAATRREDRSQAYLSLAAFASAALQARMLVHDVTLSVAVTEVLIVTTFSLVCMGFNMYVLHLLHPRWRTLSIVFWVQLVFIVAVLSLTTPLRSAAVFVYVLLAGELLATLAYFAPVAWRTQRRRFWLLTNALAIGLVVGIIESARQSQGLDWPRMRHFNLARPVLLLILVADLVQQFMRAVRQVETGNLVLTQRVAAIGGAIERTYAHLSQMQIESTRQQERRRIASDLHDDLGAKLLSITHAADSRAVSEFARDALHDMRLAVYGLTNEQVRLEVALAQWRVEVVSRLNHVPYLLNWGEFDVGDQTLSSVTYVQITRIWREMLRRLLEIPQNTVDHAQARPSSLSVALFGGPPWTSLRIEVLWVHALAADAPLPVFDVQGRVASIGGTVSVTAVSPDCLDLVMTVPFQ